jgi:hypothetical protein
VLFVLSVLLCCYFEMSFSCLRCFCDCHGEYSGLASVSSIFFSVSTHHFLMDFFPIDVQVDMTYLSLWMCIVLGIATFEVYGKIFSNTL